LEGCSARLALVSGYLDEQDGISSDRESVWSRTWLGIAVYEDERSCRQWRQQANGVDAVTWNGEPNFIGHRDRTIICVYIEDCLAQRTRS
jgi:hypothetical protein